MIWYCLPDSCFCIIITRDFVPGYSRFARYWLPAKSSSIVSKQLNNKQITKQQPNNQTTKQQDNQTTTKQQNYGQYGK